MLTKKRIVIITDCADIAYNELRGVMLKDLENSGINKISSLTISRLQKGASRGKEKQDACNLEAQPPSLETFV